MTEDVFRPIEGQVEVADPNGDLWVVEGRIPGDEESTVRMIQGKNQAQVEERFTECLYEGCSPEEARMLCAIAERDYGANVIFDYRDKIAIHEPEPRPEPGGGTGVPEP